MYFQEASQKLNAEVAPHIAGENKCFINGEVNEEILKEVFHSVMVINPSIEVYLLDTGGKILTYFAPDKSPVRSRKFAVRNEMLVRGFSTQVS